MSSSARKPNHPESHLIERDIAGRPARTWDGFVRIAGDQHGVCVPGTWHLDLPGAARPMTAGARSVRPLQAADDVSAGAWHEHLLRFVRLQHPRMQLRVVRADTDGWQQIELSAPTVPLSVVQLDRQGMARLLGADARLTMTADTRSGR